MSRRMFRFMPFVAALALTGSAIEADVRTRERTTVRFEGFLGGLMNRLAGGRDGVTTTVAVKGNRLSRMDDQSGQIIDLDEEKVYTVDIRRKEYRVQTFAEMRKQLEDARQQMSQQQQALSAEDRDALRQVGDAMEFDVDVRETGQRKAVAGHQAREVVLTVTMRGRGRTLEDSGGFVMTNVLWLGPRVAALEEVTDFNVRYFKAVYGGLFAGLDLQQMNMIAALVPGFGAMAERMAAESRKLEGTALATTSTLETVRSAEQMKALQQQQAPASGGGLGGALAGRLMRGRGGPPQPRTTTFTSTQEFLSIDAAAAAADVALPAGFRERK